MYRISDSNTDASTDDTDSNNDRGRDDQGAASMEGLQRLYSVFLPPHLKLNEYSREKRQKISRRPAVYTRDSRTTAWRRDVAQKKAAKACGTLDAFVQRKVSSIRLRSKERTSLSYKRQRSPSPLELEDDSVEELEVLEVRGDVRASEAPDPEMLSQSPADLAPDQIAPDPEMLSQSPADLAPDQIAPVSESINDAIDEITAQLAAFCFEQLEKSVTSDDALDLNADATTFTNEFRVRCYTARRPNHIFNACYSDRFKYLR
jgi:hypothetical protein